MQLVLDDDPRLADFVSRGLGETVRQPFTGFGYADDAGRLRFAAVFTEYNGANIEVSAYGPRAMRRAQIGAIMDYAFVQLGCCRLTARTRRSNKPMRRMLPKMGFMYEGTMRRFYGPTRADDAFCYGMYPANAIRWLT